jgi:hypothetical protein
MHIRLFAILLPVLLFVGCGTERPASYSSAASAFEIHGGSMLDGSLFPSDTQAISNEALDKILSQKVEFREKGRLAVLPIGGWNYQETGELASYVQALSSALSASPYVGEVMQIPRVLMPKQITVPVLREVGARLQCENVLIYNINIDVRYDWHVFTKDTSRNRVTIEAILLNVRSGIIPVTVIHDKLIDFTQAKGEESYEFFRRLQRDTTLLALQEAAEKMVHKLK